MLHLTNLVMAPIVSILLACEPSPQGGILPDENEKNDISKVEIVHPIIPVMVGNENNVIIHLNISMITPSVLTQIHLSTLGTTSLSDVEEVKIYFSANLNEFVTKDQFGKELQPEENLVFSDSKILKAGENHFWISYRLKENADISNIVMGAVKSLVIDDIQTDLNDVAIPKRIGVALRKHNDENVDTYRIPGLATTTSGTLIAVYDVRYNSSVDLQEDIDVGMSRSMDGGQSWESMKIILDMGEWDGKPENENGVGDPAILVDRQTGTIWVVALWLHGHPGERAWGASDFGMSPQETGQMVLVKSDDDGVTWSEPINITDQVKDPNWQLLLDGPGKGISMKDGTLVFPAQYKDHNKVPFSTLISSTDHGTTWQIGTGVRSETTEAQLVELADGSIMINCRNNEASNKEGIGRVVAITYDLGQTWETHPSSVNVLEESTCMASLIKESFNDYGEIMLFSNPNTHTGRFNITIKSSIDEGHTWPQENWLLLDERNGRGYSCMTKINEDYVGILYEGSQADLTFQKIRISDLVN